MAQKCVCCEIELVNGSTGDPVLFVDYAGKDDALLFDAGDLSRISLERLSDLTAVFITHHHVDHFIGLDRIVRANIDADKTLSLFGPPGTIGKVYDRIKSYEYPFFPFQKIVIDVHELHGRPGQGEVRWAHLECTRRFPPPEIRSNPWEKGPVFDNGPTAVEAVPVDHTVPCLAYALLERPGYYPDPLKLERGVLRPGLWVEQALEMLARGEPAETALHIGGGKFALGELTGRAFTASPGRRIAYVTDTAWSETSQPALLRLARRADHLYCDSFYLDAQRKRAEKYRHMTAADAADFANRAKVKHLTLIHFSRQYRGRYHKLIDEARQGFPRAAAELDE